MSTLTLIGFSLAGMVVLAGLCFLIVKLGMASAERAARALIKSEMDRDALEAEKRAGAVIAEHRTVDDTAGRLRGGRF